MGFKGLGMFRVLCLGLTGVVFVGVSMVSDGIGGQLPGCSRVSRRGWHPKPETPKPKTLNRLDRGSSRWFF